MAHRPVARRRSAVTPAMPRLRAALSAMVVLTAVLARGGPGAAAGPSAADALRAAWALGQSQPGYRFTSDIDQVVVPVASAATIGRTDQRVEMRAEGAVRAPHQAEVRIAVGGQPIAAAMGIVQDGARTFMRQGDRLLQVEHPAAAAAPTADHLAFLAGAVDVREVAPAAGGDSARRFTFRVDGRRLSEHLARELQRQLGGTLPPGIRVSPVPLVAQLHGTGTLWVDAAGLPQRQVLDLTMPRASAHYGARVHVDTTFRDFGPVPDIGRVVQDADGTWRLEAPAGDAGSASPAPGASASAAASPRMPRSSASSLPGAAATASASLATASRRALDAAGAHLADGVLPLASLALALGLTLALRPRRRRRRRGGAYAGVVAVTVVALVGGPVIQAADIADFMRRQRPAAAGSPSGPAASGLAAAGLGAAPAFAQDAGSEASSALPATGISLDPGARAAAAGAPDPAAASTAAPAPDALAQAGGGLTACGQGSTATDSDGDGLSDFEEGCRGTDPYRDDTDADLIPDGAEVAGFTVGGHTWYGAPNNVDAAGDGMVDSAEWPTPVGKGPRMDADGNGTATDAEAWDPDGDGVPNIWDDDNDGDGVPDSADLSPFSRTGIIERYTLNTQGGGTDGHQYVELQVQPEDPDRLRYNVSALDWPADEAGQMADLDNSTADARIFPMLEVLTNIRPDTELARRYGLGTVESLPDSPEPYRLYAPLMPITDNGRVVAFYARVAYPPDQQVQIRWQAKMVWVVQAQSDRDTGNSIRTDALALQTYEEPGFRVTGAAVSRSQSFESALFATPASPADDRQLFNLVFGLNAAFTNADSVTLSDVVNRFTQPLTPPEEKWGVTATVVTDRADYLHRDEGIAGTGRRLTQLLNADFGAADTPSVVTAFEERGRSYNLDQVERLDPGAALNVNLADAPLARTRGLQLNLYQAAGTEWRTLSAPERGGVIDARYADVSASLAALQPTYPGLTAVDLQSVVRNMYDTWTAGRTTVMAADGVALAASGLSDAEITAFLDRGSGQTLDAYLIDVARLAEPGGGLRMGNGPLSDWQYVRANFAETKIVGIDYAGMNVYTFRSPRTASSDFFSKARKVVTAAKDLYQLYQATQAFNSLTRSQQILYPLTRSVLEGRTLGAIGTAVAVALIWVSFGLTTDFSDPVAIKLAVASAVVATVFTILMFVISLNPVGLVLTSLFYLIDLIVFLATSGEFSLTDVIIRGITEFFYDVNLLTEVTDARLGDVTSGLIFPEIGPRRFNAFWLSSEVTGTIEKKSAGDLGDLLDSYVTGRFDGTSTRSTVYPLAADPRCRTSDSSTLQCKTPVGVGFLLDQAVRDVDMSVEASITTRVYYEECTLQGAFCFRKRITDTLPEDNEPSEIALDVLPFFLDDFWAWDAAPVVAGHAFNPDVDGDGRPDRDEIPAAPCTDPAAQHCTRSDDWDTDDDGVPDGHEVTHAGELGLNPAVADTDGDGLSDAEELRRHTDPATADTDGDGLSDGDEAFQAGDTFWQPGTAATSVGGWLFRLPGGPLVPAFPDPLRADADGDGLSDATERANQTSPYAPNTGPVLILTASPLPPAPARAPGLFVLPGTAITLDLELLSVGRHAIDQPLELCLPSLLTGVAGGDLGGDSSLKATVSADCGGDPAATLLTWAFSASDPLALGGSATTSITAIAGAGATETRRATVTGRLPYRDDLDRDGNGSPDLAELAPSLPITVDADDPLAAITTPLDGAVVGGGTTTLVVGGTAADAGSWVTSVDLDLPGGGTATATDVSPWSYAWTLPADGVHTLSATATDAVGRASTPATATVTVDNTAPTASFATPADGAFINDPSGEGVAITIAGGVADNLSGIQRLQIQIDDRAWVPVALTGGDRPEFPTTASWQHDWRLPGGNAAQGRHTVRVRAFDRAGNRSTVGERTIVVDVLPPGDGLTNRRFETDPPSYGAGSPVDLRGLANDAGNGPLAPRPAALAGTLGSLEDATVWISPDSVGEDDGGVSATWLGDFNGDRLADLAVGLPAAADGAGRVALVYGRPGGFALPPTPELIGDSPTTYVGEAGAGIGAHVSAVGDANGDGLDDVLVGDPANGRAHLVFGRRGGTVPDAVLDADGSAGRVVLNGPGLGGAVAAAGDANGDGLGDLLVGVGGGQPGWVLVLGKVQTAWQPEEDVTVQAAAVVAAPPAVAPARGVGDMDGDGAGELVVADPTGAIGPAGRYHLYRGDAMYAAAEGRALTATASFASTGGDGRVAALGDISGDGRADFAYHDGTAPKVVFGSAGGSGSCCLSLGGYAPAASRFLAAVGNVDADAAGLRDLVVGAADGSAYLFLGQAGLNPASSPPAVAARITDVAGAASLSPLAGADANADGSSDLVLVPGSGGTAVLATSFLHFGRPPHVAADALPRGLAGGPGVERPAARHGRGAVPAGLPGGHGPAATDRGAGADRPWAALDEPARGDAPHRLAALDRHVDDDWAGTAAGADPDGAGPATSFGTDAFATIQAAVTAAATGDTVRVRPGVYAGFEITGAAKNDLTVAGSDPDAVFVDGATFGGATAAAYVHDVAGVALEGLTLRNADRGVWLDNAGVGGYTSPLAGFGDPALRIALSRVLVQDCTVGLYTDRDSAMAVADSTIAARGPADRHVRVDPTTPDPVLNPAWSTSPPADLPVGKSLAAGGSVQMLLNRPRALLGGGSREFYAYDEGTDAWTTRPSPPLDVVAGSATTVDASAGLLYLMSQQPRFAGVPGTSINVADPRGIQDFAVSGNHIYAGGQFDTAGSVTANGIARYDTVAGTWSALGQGMRATAALSPSCPCDPSVNAVAVDGNGHVYVGGFFDQAVNGDGTIVSAGGVAKWNGSTWSALGSGVTDNSGTAPSVTTIVANGTDIYVGGNFDKAGGTTVNSIAKWNGSAWSALGSGVTRPASPSGTRPGFVWAIDIQGSDVYVGGNFDSTPTDHITRWDGSAFQAVGPVASPLSYVVGIAFVGGVPIVSDRDALTGVTPSVRRLSAGAWQDITPVGFGSNPQGSLIPHGGKAYLMPENYGYDQVLVYDGGAWSRLPGSGSPFANPMGPYGGQVWTLAFFGADIYVGGVFTSVNHEDTTSFAATNFVRLTPTPRLLRYPEAPTTWVPRATPPRLPAVGATLAADGTDAVYATFGGGTEFMRHNIAANSWTTLAVAPATTTTGAASVWAAGHLYLLPGDSTVNGSAAFHRFTPNGGLGTWTAMAGAPFDLGSGADLEWDGADDIYAVQGGNGRTFARYSIAGNAWTVLGTGGSGLSTPAGSNAGGGLVLDAPNAKLYFARGGGTGVDRVGPIGVKPQKLTLDRVAFVTPDTTAAQTWLNPDLLTGGTEPADYLVGGAGSQWVAGAGTSWSPSGAGAPLSMTFVTATAARFLDAAGGVLRVATGTALTAGYHDAHPDAHVFTSLAACAPCALPMADPDRLTWGVDAFDTLQAAIDTGAPRVLVHAGSYAQAFHLVTGVQVIGAGAGLTVVTPPPTPPVALARAEGVRGSRLARVTLAGAAGVDGARVEDGARGVTLARAIVRDSGTGVRLRGAATDVEVVNNTFARNGTGLAAELCAPVDVRNTIFADHTTRGLAYQACAATKLHTYNAYSGNAADLAIDGTPTQAPGAGEVFADPAFVDPAPPANDFRPSDGSPVIDAGNPSDPVPPGAGGRVDIGYVETGGAAFFADDDYCAFCDNDGLFWQVDAFDVVGDALAAAANEITALGCGLASVGGVPCDTQWTVGVGPGTYPERVVVPSHVSLVGTGADDVTIDAGGSSSPVRVQGGISVEVRALTLTGSAPGGGGVVVDGASSGVHISRNLIAGNAGSGVAVAGRSTGAATFNTVVDNGGPGYVALGSGTWLRAESSIVSGNDRGLQTLFGGQVFDNFNLVHGNTTDYADDAGTGLAPGPDSITGQAPGFAGGGSYQLTPASPAVDAANPLADVPPGGGARADMGYRELVGSPLALLLGREGLSAATGNAGIASVQVGFRRIADPTLPITDTASLPTAWLTATLATPSQTTSYWTRTLTPADGDGLYRVYSRALDRAGNRVDDPTAQFRGAFSVDGVAPVVAWLGPAGGTSTTSPLELRAQVADYVAGSFNVETIGFEVDGLPVAAEWAPEPWDPTSGDPRVFRAWVSLASGPHTVRAVATDRAGNDGASSPAVGLSITGASPADTTSPTGSLVAPADGAVTRADVTFTGTVADAGGSGVAGVQVSLDGGRAWSAATITGGTWSLDWTAPDGLDHESFPVRVRALDRAGNVSVLAAIAVTIDSVAPAGVAPVTFSLPAGSHVDAFTDLDIAWTPPQSGGDVAEVRLAVDQVPDTTPTTVVAGQTATRALGAPGEWYVHIATADAVGNTLVRHFGPWHVGTVEETTFLAAGMLDRLFGPSAVDCADRRQTIDVDGVLELDLDEWRDDTELLATDERSGVGQDLYFAWDGVNSFLGWQGARWIPDGTLFAYFDVAAGGTTTPMAATPGGIALGLPALPFAADYAAAVDSDTLGGLWRWNGSAWSPESLPAADFAFAHGEMAGTEVKLPWGAPEVAGAVRLFAFAVNDAGTPTSVFPTANAAAGPWSSSYAWADRCNTEPTSGIPRARLARLALNSPQSPLAPWGHDQDLDYVVTVENPEADPLVGAQVMLSATPGLGYRTVAGSGATCGTCPVGGAAWTLDIPPVPARASAAFTVTGRLASLLTGIDAVTTTARLDLPITPNGESVLERTFSHRVDSRAPTAGVMLPAGTIGAAGLDLLGEAHDGDGIGVDFVEVRVDGGMWMLASGKALWTIPVVPPSGATSVQVEVRATDYYGQESPIADATLAVDTAPPAAPSFVVPPVIIGDFVDLGGTAADTAPPGGALLRVEVQVDDPSGPWLPAIVNTTTGVVTWLFTWDVPSTIGSVHQLRARAVDAAGNAGPPTPWQTTTTFPEPPVDAGPDQRTLAGLPVEFAGTFTPWGGQSPYFIRWDFGDGGSHTAAVAGPGDPALSPTHTYTRGGAYRVTLSVTHDGTLLAGAAATGPTTVGDAPDQAGGVTVSDTLVVTVVGIGDPTAAEILSLTATAAGDRAIVAWTTGPEAGVTGFHVHRAPTPDGPWSRVNAALVAARGGGASGTRYDLADGPGAGTFHYRLEVVHDTGPSTWHGPVSVTLPAGGSPPGRVFLPSVQQR